MPIPVISIAQMREWERANWAAGKTEAEVIRRVGAALARRALELTHREDVILILAGIGHNGDDARAAQEFLNDRRVELLNVIAPESNIPELEQALSQKPALIIDGLFGIGLNRPLADEWNKFIEAVNRSGIPILAVDVPSGLNADTGDPITPGAAIEAAVTVTIGAPKIGLLAQNAWAFVGRLEVADDVGLTSCPHTSELNWTLPEDFKNFPQRRTVTGHKGVFGHLAIIAGSLGFHGAAVLAARGAQRAQPGLITLSTHESIYHAVAAQLQAVMVNLWTPDMKLPDTTSAVLIGPGMAAPGLADSMALTVRRLWRDVPLPVIVDASVLNWLPHGPAAKNAIRIITPHPGEAARLLKAAGGAGAGKSAGIPARNLAAVWQLLGRVEGTSDARWPERGGNFCESFRQPASGAGRQRRYAGGVHRGTAGAAGVANGCRKNNSLRRLATRRGGGPIAGGTGKLGRRGFDWRTWQRALNLLSRRAGLC